MPLALLARLIALVALALAVPAGAQTFPKLSGLVVDDADVLPPEVEADLTNKLEALQKDTKRQLVVATIRDLQGESVASYGPKLGRAWGVGLADIDNGAILFVAPNNPTGQRGPRIEVGYGLEPVLTDAYSSLIINQRMMPRLRGGDLPGAMTAGADAIIAQLRATPEEAQARQDAAIREFDRTHKRTASSGGGGGWVGLMFWVMVTGFIVLAMVRRGARGTRYRRRGGSGMGEVILWTIANEVANSAMRGGSSSWGGGLGSGGGGSDGSWGGGGFTGGGGGDFGGGGASGDW